MRLTGTPIERLLPRLVADGACLLWTGGTDSSGYGAISGGRRGLTLRTHVVAWEAVNGPVPEGLELDHTCERSLCCAVAHLEPVTHAENLRRRHSRDGLCPKCALPLVERNGKGRICKPCHAAYVREKRAA